MCPCPVHQWWLLKSCGGKLHSAYCCNSVTPPHPPKARRKKEMAVKILLACKVSSSMLNSWRASRCSTITSLNPSPAAAKRRSHVWMNELWTGIRGKVICDGKCNIIRSGLWCLLWGAKWCAMRIAECWAVLRRRICRDSTSSVVWYTAELVIKLTQRRQWRRTWMKV